MNWMTSNFPAVDRAEIIKHYLILAHLGTGAQVTPVIATGKISMHGSDVIISIRHFPKIQTSCSSQVINNIPFVQIQSLGTDMQYSFTI